MDLSLLLLCGFALLAANCQSGVVIQPCPGGQRNVSEYTNVSLACGNCTTMIDWYIDCSNAQGTRYQYIGGCHRTDCSFQVDSSFRIKATTTTETGQLDGVLDIVRVTRNDACRVLCKCYRYYFYYNSSADIGYYMEGNDSCQIFVEENEKETKNASSDNVRGGVIGGVVAAVFIIAIIGIVIAVYIVKWRRAPLYDTTRHPANNEHNYDDLAGDARQSPEIQDGMTTRKTKNEHCYQEMALTEPVFVVPRTHSSVSSP